MFNVETCARGEKVVLMHIFSTISNHIKMLWKAEHNPVPVLSQRKSTGLLVSQEVLGVEANTQTYE